MVTACLLHNEPTSYSSLARLRSSVPEPQRKQVLTERIKSVGVDAKLCDLSMGRVKVR